MSATRRRLVIGGVVLVALSGVPGVAVAWPTSAAGTIEGGATTAEAPVIRPGQYLDPYARGDVGEVRGTTKYYALDLRSGDTPHLSATIIPLTERTKLAESLALNLTVVTAAGRNCGPTADSTVGVSTYGKLGPQTSTVQAVEVGTAEWRCPRGEPVYLRVARTGTAFGTRQLPVELVFRLEPKVTDAGPAAVTAVPAALPVPATGTARTARAGAGFDDAPVLPPGTYRGTVSTGDSAFFRVHLGWGQRLSYRIEFDAPASAAFGSAATNVSLATPLRGAAEPSRGGTDVTLLGGSDPHTLSGSTAAPVRYRNRTSDNALVRDYAVDGDYFLVVDMSYRLGADDTLAFPFTLTVAISGGEDGPTYAVGPESTGSTASADRIEGTDRVEEGGWLMTWLLVGTGALLAVVVIGLAVRWERTQLTAQR